MYLEFHDSESDDLLAINPESCDLLEHFASEECFNLIFLEFLTSTCSASTQPSSAHLSAESLLSICRILSNATESVNRAGARAPKSLPKHHQDPNPNILPCILRHLQPWRLRHLSMESDTRPHSLEYSMGPIEHDRDLVDLSTRLSGLVNHPNPDFLEPIKISPSKMRIRWLGRTSVYGLNIANYASCDLGEVEDPAPPKLVSEGPNLHAIPLTVSSAKNKELPEVNAASFRNGCLSCRRPRIIVALSPSFSNVHPTTQNRISEPQLGLQSSQFISSSGVMASLESFLPSQTIQPTTTPCTIRPSKGRRVKYIVSNENIAPSLSKHPGQPDSMLNASLSTRRSKSAGTHAIAAALTTGPSEIKIGPALPKNSSLVEKSSGTPNLLTRKMAPVYDESLELVKTHPFDSSSLSSSPLHSSRAQGTFHTASQILETPLMVYKSPLDQLSATRIAGTRRKASTLTITSALLRRSRKHPSSSRSGRTVLGQRNVAE